MSNDLKFPRESRPDGEGKRARRRNNSAALFTHFLTQTYKQGCKDVIHVSSFMSPPCHSCLLNKGLNCGKFCHDGKSPSLPCCLHHR